jgi:tetratricopeptide (TPR) repeat protein
MGNKGAIALCYFKLGLLEEAAGPPQIACDFFQKCLVLRKEIGDRAGTARALEGIGRMAEALGDEDSAARIFGAADALRASIAAPLYPNEQQKYGQAISSAKERFPSAWQEGKLWSLDEAITHALSIGAA